MWSYAVLSGSESGAGWNSEHGWSYDRQLEAFLPDFMAGCCLYDQRHGGVRRGTYKSSMRVHWGLETLASVDELSGLAYMSAHKA